MGSETGKTGRGVVAIAAAWLHAFVLLASLVLVPADPLFKTYENAATMALADQAPDEAVEKKSARGENELGMMYERGQGVTSNPIEATKLFRLAAGQAEEPELRARSAGGAGRRPRRCRRPAQPRRELLRTT